MRRFFNPTYLAGICLLACLAGGTLFRLDAIDRFTAQEAQAVPPVRVEAAFVKQGEISQWVAGEGTALAVQKRHLLFETAGKVAFLSPDSSGGPLREGAKVSGPRPGEKLGRLLARLDIRGQTQDLAQTEAGLSEARQMAAAARADLSQAKSVNQAAQSAYERARSLFEKELLPKSRLEQARAEAQNALAGVESAEAGFKAAQSRADQLRAGLNRRMIGMEETAIHAPFDGVIARLNISEGDFSNPAGVDFTNAATLLDTAPITVIDPGLMEITLNLPVFSGMGVKEGQTAVVTWGGLDWEDDVWEEGDPLIRGVVHSVSPVLNIGGRTVRVKVRFTQETVVIPHGMFVACWIETQQKPDALVIPMEGLMARDDQPFVFLIREGRAQRQPVKTGLAEEGRVEILEGLAENDCIALKGKYRLRHGLAVEVLK